MATLDHKSRGVVPDYKVWSREEFLILIFGLLDASKSFSLGLRGRHVTNSLDLTKVGPNVSCKATFSENPVVHQSVFLIIL